MLAFHFQIHLSVRNYITNGKYGSAKGELPIAQSMPNRKSAFRMKPVRRTARVPLRIIKRQYGSGRDSNADVAADDIYEALQLVSEYHGQYPYHFSFDDAHPNPWYHAMVFEIEGISDSAYEQFLEKLASLGLTETSND